MSLANYVAPTRAIRLPDGKDYPVQGLSASDVVLIVTTHKEGMTAAFNKIVGAAPKAGVKPEEAETEITGILTDLLSDFPLLGAHIIAAGFGDAKQIDVAAKLPVGVQLEALDAIGEMTFEVSGGAKNVVEIVIKMLNGSRSLMDQVSKKP